MFSCTFAVIQILALYRLFLGRSGFVEKYPKIKYAISDRPHWQLDLCEFFITEWTTLKLKILTDIKITFKKNQTFSQSAQ
jgi:hypothetical protein